MDNQTSMRAAAEAVSQTTAGFFQGLGWALAGLAVTVVLAVWHTILLLGLPITAGSFLYRWLKRNRSSETATMAISPRQVDRA